MLSDSFRPLRSALYLPATNQRAIDKSRNPPPPEPEGDASDTG